MDIKVVLSDIKNNKVRDGVLYKRSKFLKQWRERWIVLTTNFLYTFTNKKMQEVTDVIDLKQIKSYKSYLRKDEEMIPPGFKLRSAEDMYYFCARNCYQKWSWIVSLERLMDYKYVGATNYNNMQWVKTKGFESQIEFENGGAKVPHIEPPQQKLKEQPKKNVDEEAEKIMKQLAEQQKQLQKKKQQLQQKQATLQQKRQEEQKLNEQKKKVEEAPPSPVKQEPPKEQQKQQPPAQRQQSAKFSELRNMFEKKASDSSVPPAPTIQTEKKENKGQTKVDTMTSLYSARSKIVNGLFEEFRQNAYELSGIKYVIDFIINVTADEQMGYSSYVIIQGKSHKNQKYFAQIFIQVLEVYQDYQKCENIMKFIECCVFQMPGLFNPAQTLRIQKKLKDFFLIINNEDKLYLIIKNMFIMHKLNRYDKNQIYNKLDKLVKESKNENTRNWAKKLRDDL